jgi:Rieske Fe-S protein
MTGRRAFCLRACQAVSALAAAMVVEERAGARAAGAAPAALPTVKGTVVDGTVRVPTTSNALASDDARVRVVSTAGSYLVARMGPRMFVGLAATCSHEACGITDIENDAYICPCHGSRFDVSGRVLTGPAETSLYKVATSFSDDVLTITI